MAKKHRTQILLEEEQYQLLSRIAELEGRSMSDIARRVMDAGFAVLRDDLESAVKRVRVLNEGRAAYNTGSEGKEQS
ncbi:MAG TPA: hypothetical protein PKW33_00685 [Anaerolineaceae bacterium]|nr:hypothetical protein [Anaerolineaceae bacterium]HPN50073.1 hypothetical protein [Anaerolineaceae bacterium]